MIQEFNFNRVLVQLVKKEKSIIWTPEPQKKAKTLDGIVRLVGSKVAGVLPGDKVKIYNEGIVIEHPLLEMRIINEYGIALKVN